MAQQLVNGLFVGSVYALFALGYTLVFGVLDILNLAHQAVFTAAAFFCLTLVLRLQLPLLPALAVTGVSLVLMAALTLLLNRTRLGMAIRAVAQDVRAAGLRGVDVDRVFA